MRGGNNVFQSLDTVPAQSRHSLSSSYCDDGRDSNSHNTEVALFWISSILSLTLWMIPQAESSIQRLSELCGWEQDHLSPLSFQILYFHQSNQSSNLFSFVALSLFSGREYTSNKSHLSEILKLKPHLSHVQLRKKVIYF